MASLVQKSNYLISLDKIFGLRAWGLILYGALPSNLALLGALEVKIGQINAILPFFFIPASILPIFLTFMLIRDRHREWYLTTDFHNLRSAITTIIILILATLIIGISGIIHNRYSIVIPKSWNYNEWTAIAESFLLAVVSLVISTTFFVAALTKEVKLPGLPSADFVKLMTSLRNNLRKLRSSDIWKECIHLDDNKLIDLAKTIKQDLDQATTSTGNYLAKESLKPIYEDMTNLINVLEENRGSSNNPSKLIQWKIYFADFQALSDDQKTRRSSNKEKFASIERLKRLKLGD